MHTLCRRAALTRREVQLLALVARGQTAQEAGDALGIAKRTAETHLANATAKLRAINRVHAVALVVRDELVSV